MNEDDAPVKPGDVLAGKYRVEQILGVGGMGVVVAATHLQLNDKVAIKFLLPHVAQSGEHVARFLREGQAAVRIKSVHIARVSDVGMLESGSPYMVMEHLNGKDLAATLYDRGRLSAVDAVTYVLQACGIIHRDLKPGNLFLTYGADGHPCIKVLDFGISKSTQAGADKLTRTQSVMGSPLYMSPEQMRSARNVDARTDIWSIGVVLYELLIGEVPFVAETMPQLVALVLENPAPKLRDMLPTLPESLEQIVARCLASKVDDRYPSVAHLAADLAAVLGTDQARISAEKIARVLDGVAPKVDTTGQQLALATTAAAPRPRAQQGTQSGTQSSTQSGSQSGSQPAPRLGVQTAPGTALGRTDMPIADADARRKPVGWIVGGLLGVVGLAGGIAFAVVGNGAGKGSEPLGAPAVGSMPEKSVAKPDLKAAVPSATSSALLAPTALAPTAASSARDDAGVDAASPTEPKPTNSRPIKAPTPAPKPSTSTDKAISPDDWERKG
jgi:serine/threonine-protein kinase